MADMRDVPPRPTWNCGHPVSPNPTLDEARLHIGHTIKQAAVAQCEQVRKADR